MLFEDPPIVQAVADGVIRETNPTVFIRHYNFIDFKKFAGSSWSPDFYNVVRDPIDRVS